MSSGIVSCFIVVVSAKGRGLLLALNTTAVYCKRNYRSLRRESCLEPEQYYLVIVAQVICFLFLLMLVV